MARRFSCGSGEASLRVVLKKQQPDLRCMDSEPPEERTDTLARFAAGDVDAFEMLFRRHQAEVYRWIVRLVRHPGVAEELTVETFWRIHRRRKQFDVERPFEPWARRIATNAAIDYLRSAQCSFEAPEGPEQVSGPERRGELRDSIERAFDSLSPRLRIAATLALIEGRSYEEIGSALGISISAVKMRLSRAVRLLRARLERMGVRP